jgi:hypothetical protein
MFAGSGLRFALIAVALLSLTASAGAFEQELTAYQEILDRICYTGVTSEAEQRYQALVEALDRAGSGGGRASNFAGPRTPERAYLDCVSVEPGGE